MFPRGIFHKSFQEPHCTIATKDGRSTKIWYYSLELHFAEIVNVGLFACLFSYLLDKSRKHLVHPIFHNLYDNLDCYCQCNKNDRLACLLPTFFLKVRNLKPTYSLQWIICTALSSLVDWPVIHPTSLLSRPHPQGRKALVAFARIFAFCV